MWPSGPDPVQQPHPPVWIPVSASQETLDWAGRENVPISPGALGTLAGRQDMVRYYGRQLAENGHTLTPEHIIGTANAYVADSREQALAEAGPYMVYFYRTLFRAWQYGQRRAPESHRLPQRAEHGVAQP